MLNFDAIIRYGTFACVVVGAACAAGSFFATLSKLTEEERGIMKEMVSTASMTILQKAKYLAGILAICGLTYWGLDEIDNPPTKNQILLLALGQICFVLFVVLKVATAIIDRIREVLSITKSLVDLVEERSAADSELKENKLLTK
jgi:uncharacterized membrane protein